MNFSPSRLALLPLLSSTCIMQLKALTPVPNPNLLNTISLSMYSSPPSWPTLVPNYIYSSGFEPQPLAEQLSIHTPIPIPYKAPIDWARWATFAAFTLAFGVTLRYIAPILQNRWTWAAVTIGVSIVMISGHMFTRIRGAPFTSGGSWIAPGYQNQYGQETQVVAGICKASSSVLTKQTLIIFGYRLTLGRIILNVDVCHAYTNVPRKTENPDICMDGGDYDHLLRLDLLV